MRFDRGLLQKDVAQAIGVTVDTILNWELNYTEPSVAYYPKVMDYLGYCPIPNDADVTSLGALVHRHRIHRGLTLRKAAVQMGVDPGALSEWEHGARTPLAKSAIKLTRFIGPPQSRSYPRNENRPTK